MKRARATLVIVLAALLSILNVACKSQGAGNNTGGGNPANGDSSGATGEAYATPPFQTKEPERYQARMVISLRADDKVESSDTFIVRDGERRREDYEPGPGIKVSDIKIQAGHFLLLHDGKLYAEVTGEAEGSAPGPPLNLPEDFAPDRLINESRTEARYQKLGVEELNGRSVTRYRVSLTGAEPADQGAQPDQLIWIDEHLGMPVKSETTSKDAGHVTTYTMEMLDIKEEADQSLFAVPQDYKRVAMKEIQARITAAKSPAPGAETGAKAQ
jgi:outer membrane lipoprotein-sorting protein